MQNIDISSFKESFSLGCNTFIIMIQHFVGGYFDNMTVAFLLVKGMTISNMISNSGLSIDKKHLPSASVFVSWVPWAMFFRITLETMMKSYIIAHTGLGYVRYILSYAISLVV